VYDNNCMLLDKIEELTTSKLISHFSARLISKPGITRGAARTWGDHRKGNSEKGELHFEEEKKRVSCVMSVKNESCFVWEVIGESTNVLLLYSMIANGNVGHTYIYCLFESSPDLLQRNINTRLR
jgi:hypothetical protein